MLANPFDFSSAYRQLQAVERTFVDGYVTDIEQAAHKSGEKLQDVLGRQAMPSDPRAKEMLGRALVRAAIFERVRDLAEELELSEFKTLKEIRSIAYSNMGDYMTPGLEYLDLDFSTCTPEQLAAVKSFEIQESERGGRKIKFVTHDKLRALEMLAKYQGLLTDDKWTAQERAARSAEINADDTTESAAEKWSRRIGD